ncbi:hypothetical protein PR202_gb16291 [Eleusine coracana subsp. coracana]|uniref:F-box domain-containing protein n=1 Tax=Eleusine coracana subsp. coracana TaxID=191504 RepID=A0AAV5EXS6_ELECO|nr:hypothetical protein PR202_gb16291 [Eleusine coracana subsp. coracana]
MSSPRRARSTPSGADQLSALPEDVIHHVLSLLPAHEAVRTCVLARRWRHLWTSAPSIRVTGVKGWPDADRFLCFVDRLLTLHRGGSTVLSWEFHLDETDFDPFFNICNVTGKCHTSRLMERILECNVGTLRLCLNNMAPMIGIALLPDLILVSQHLTMLELHGVITNGRVLDFSGCPMLVKMKMESSCIDVKEFSSASLKQLIMVDCQFCKEKRTRFSLPSLVSLELNLYTGRAPLLGSMSSLETATVSLNSQCADSCECEDDYCDGSGCYKDSDNDDKSCVLLKAYFFTIAIA